MKYQLVIQFPVTEDFDFDAIIELETKLTLEMGEGYMFDGHDFGASDINLFIQTDQPEQGYEKVFDMLSVQLVPILRVAYRLTGSDEFIYLHPANCKDNFSVK